MRIALIQSNPLVGDLGGNRANLAELCQRAAEAGANLALAPELALWGYPPRDLLLRAALVREQQHQLERLSQQLPPGMSLLLGVVEACDAGLYNAIALVQPQQWQLVARKRLLPSYDVFDERRYFLSGQRPCLLNLPQGQGPPLRLGLTICEDLWVPDASNDAAPNEPDPIAELIPLQPQLLINLSASPFGRGKAARRHQLAAAAAQRLGCAVLYVNQVGGNDELVFDGSSFVIDRQGQRLLQLPCAETALACWDSPSGPAAPPALAQIADPPEQEQLWRVLVLGVRDYAAKCGFRSALLGLSGGIDSALVTCLAVAALGADGVRALMMPSQYSSEGSIADSEALAVRLGLASSPVPIQPLMAAFDQSLSPALGGAPVGLTAENLQSRIRGTLLMAVANAEGQLLLATGNKSELAVGYCTLYGDMNGGLAVIGDLYKTEVYALADWLDSSAAREQRLACGLPPDGPLIGTAIRQKAPSAELRPDQKDSDSLPDYSLLDPLLRRLVEQHSSPEELIADGAEPQLVQRISRLLQRAEFKRRQAAPVLKLSSRSFGSGWRMPIAAFN